MAENKTLLTGSIASIHGHRGNSNWAAPVLVAASNEANRKDQGNTIKANEYLDQPEVLEEKVNLLVEMIKKAKCCTAYTGAGLSRAAGIADYATRAKNSISATGVPKLKSNLDAQPTLSHKVLVAMEKEGFLHHYVQQNHDGLPQKAGFPQEKINEIHGAWYDPSNPVVKFSGNLRGDLFDWMYEMEKRTDLCLCLGTSLSGMNADRMAKTPAKRMLRGDPSILGTVIINLQQTNLDRKTAIRIWAKLDDVFAMVAKKLQLNMDMDYSPKIDAKLKNKFVIPYDANGFYDKKSKMILNLNPNEQIKICVPGASNENCLGSILGNDKEGNYVVVVHEERRNYKYCFGRWWPLSLMEGKVQHLPLVNLVPEYES